MKITKNVDNRTYSELIEIESFEDRFKYLSLNGLVGGLTFGGQRYQNQNFYRSLKWKSIRNKVILRDNALDLAHNDYPIGGSIYIHHINPITIDDILEERSCVFDLENLVCVSFKTHNAIHYGNEENLPRKFVERRRNDTCPWR